MADVMLFNSIFSDCSTAYSPVTVQGLRVGYPKNLWVDVGEEVRSAAGKGLYHRWHCHC